jgi:hypothetical protein
LAASVGGLFHCRLNSACRFSAQPRGASELGRRIGLAFSTRTTLQLNIDGRTLGEVVASKLVDLMKFDTSSPAFNGTSLLGP